MRKKVFRISRLKVFLCLLEFFRSVCLQCVSCVSHSSEADDTDVNDLLTHHHSTTWKCLAISS
ncbi:hypothetical protein LINGRAHAP2_LOCUS28926 [Linum grandiflorum]